MASVGFIGLGRMGRPMASHLCAKGFSLVVFDVNPEPVRHLEQLGARAAASAGEVGERSEIVLTMLPSSAIVEEVVAGPDGVLVHVQAGTLLMDMSTIDPRVTDLVAAACATERLRFRGRPGRPPGESRRSWRVPFHGGRRRRARSHASSRCSRQWARPFIIAGRSAPGCARSW